MLGATSGESSASSDIIHAELIWRLLLLGGLLRMVKLLMMGLLPFSTGAACKIFLGCNYMKWNLGLSCVDFSWVSPGAYCDFD
jgi:hypothetical protein